MAVFYNQATLSYNGMVTNSNITTGELLEVLSATKTAIIDRYVANDNVTYVISIVNSGTTALNGLTVTDQLGAYTFDCMQLVPLTYVPDSIHYYINGVLQTAPAVNACETLTISGINVPACGNVMLIYAAKVNEYAPLEVGSSITNVATIQGACLTADITVSETIYPECTAALTISKSICPTTVTENGQITYTFVIQNTGNTPATAEDCVTVTDTFNPILNPISVTFNGAAWTSPENYTYDECNGEFATVPGQITVPAATYTQDTENGNWIVTPGVSVLTVTGTVQ